MQKLLVHTESIYNFHQSIWWVFNSLNANEDEFIYMPLYADDWSLITMHLQYCIVSFSIMVHLLPFLTQRKGKSLIFRWKQRLYYAPAFCHFNNEKIV
jgi:hypothetical protein